MQKASWLRTCLFLPVVLFLYACTAGVKAPVDSRGGMPAAGEQAAYSQATSGRSTAEQGRNYHVVVKGDTLYSIAWRYGHDYRDIARWNQISGNYVIYPGQFIRLKPLSKKAQALQPGPIIAKNKSVGNATKKTRASSGKRAGARPKQSAQTGSTVSWRWPTRGKLVKLNTPTSRKGVDIAGRAGQQISAAASGDVVYSGSGLLGYGKLIIIKHNDRFLSAYAHNEKLYAKEGDRVEAGQKIATMGLGNKGRPILHFEIRKDGTPVNPLQHLPENRS